MKIYIIENRVWHLQFEVTANSAQEACEKLGWLIGDCYVKEVKEAK